MVAARQYMIDACNELIVVDARVRRFGGLPVACVGLRYVLQQFRRKRVESGLLNYFPGELLAAAGIDDDLRTAGIIACPLQCRRHRQRRAPCGR